MVKKYYYCLFFLVLSIFLNGCAIAKLPARALRVMGKVVATAGEVVESVGEIVSK